MASSLLYGGNGAGKANPKPASEFVARILHGVTMAHMHHLTTDSYAKHMALGDLYEGLQSGADELAEAYMGCEGVVLSFAGGAMTIGSDAIADVQSLYDYVETSRTAMGDESHIQNIVDEICSTLSTALYKLKRLA